MKKMDEMADVDSCLRVYRKAILLGRKRVIVECVGRLVELDSTQDWYEVLVQAEDDLLGEMEEAYQAAKEGKDEARAKELEEEFAAIHWSRSAAQLGASELAAAYQKKKEEAERLAKEEEERVRQVAQEAAKERARQIEEAARQKTAAEEAERKQREQEEAERARKARWQKAASVFWSILILLGAAGAAYYLIDWSQLITMPAKNERIVKPKIAPTNVQTVVKSVVTNTPPLSPAALLSQMKKERELSKVLNLREELREKFAAVPFVKEVKPLPFTEAEAVAVLKGGLKEWQGTSLPGVLTNAALFQAFVTNQILPIAAAPFETEMMAIYQEKEVANGTALSELAQDQKANHSTVRVFLGLSRGKPIIQTMETRYSIEGELYELSPKPVARSRIWATKEGEIKVERMGFCEELEGMIQFATRPNLTAADFEKEALRRIGIYVENVAADISAYRCVQLIARYLEWMEVPADLRIEEVVQEAKKLAAPIAIEGFPSELTWTIKDDERIQARNAQCVQFLQRLGKEKFAALYQEVRERQRARARRANWEVRFVGRLNCPSGEGWQKNPNKFFLSIFDERAKGHYPLYVLRKEDGRLVFRRVLEWDANTKRPTVTPGMGKQLFACDPLFQILDGKQTVDIDK